VSADSCRTRFGYWIERVRVGEDVVVTRRGTPVIKLTTAAPATTPLLGMVESTGPERDNQATPHPCPPAVAGSAA
jgi:prevent-host-death family protein